MANRFLSNIRINDAYTFPASDGTNNQVIKTDGSGNLSFGQLAADSASVMYKDTFTGDGSTSVFSLANALNDEVQSNIYIDGVYQSKSTYSVSGTTVTFSTAPLSGHEIEVISTTGINSGPTAIFTDTFTANGSATAFTLGQTVHSENQTIVFLNGVYQFKGTYTLSGTTLTLDTAPANGVSIEVMSIGSAYSGGDILYDHDFASAGLMTTNGSGVYSITANNSANWNTAYGWGDHSTQSYATQSYVGTQISNLVDSSPATLDTLNELAAALGDDPNFATTTANSIGLKAPSASPTFTGTSSFTLNDGIFIKAINGTNNIASTNVWGYGLYEGASKLGEISLVRNGSSSQMYMGTTGANQVLRIGSANKVTALTIDASQNTTFAGTVLIDGLSNYTGLEVKGAGASRPQIKFSNVNQGTLAQIYGTESNSLVTTVPAGLEYQVRNANGASGNHVFKSYNTAILTLDGGTNNATFAGSSVFIDGAAYSSAASIRQQSSALIFSGGSNGYYFNKSDNSSTHMFINSSGNIGIGTTSPLTKLHVSNANAVVTIEATTNGQNCSTWYKANGNNQWETGCNISAGTDYQIYDRLNSASRMVVGHDGDVTIPGNVGIGTTSPSTKLHVVDGNNYAQFGDLQGNSTMLLRMADNAGFPVEIQAYGTEMRFNTASSNGATPSVKMNITSGGNVGIGDTSPSFPLVISKSSSTSSNGADLSMRLNLVNPDQTNNNWALINFSDGTSQPGSGFMGMQFTDHTNNYGDLSFGTRGSGGYGERMRIDSSGKVSVGTPVVGQLGVRGTTNDSTAYSFEAANSSGNSLFAVRNDGLSFFPYGNVGIGTTSPSEKLEVTGNFKLNGTTVQEGTGNNLTFKHRTANSNSYTGGNATCKFGRFYWTPAHWMTGAPVIKVTLHCKYYQGERREYIIKAGYGDTNPVINELQPSSTSQRITLLVGPTTAAGYNYAGHPAYYVDLQWVQTAYIWGWAQIESQTGFLTSNPTSGWGGLVMDSGITQTIGGLVTNYTSFFPGRILLPGLDGKTQVHPDVSYRTSDGELFYQSSSERYKTNIVNLESSLNKVDSLRPVRFTDINTNEPAFGLIAEEVNELIPDVVFSKDNQIEGISYSNLTPFLIKAIQELKADNDSLRARIETLENN